MAMIAGLVSAGTAIYGMTQGTSAENVQMPQQWQMPNMGGAAQGAYSGIQGLPGQNMPGQNLDQYQQFTQNLLNNPYAQMFQQGANIAGPMGQQAAQGAYGAGQQFQQAGQSQIPYAQNIMQTAFDPQNELYARMQQQTVDQGRAGQAARGVSTTPYGASLENDSLRKFNIDWQNQQLQRQIQGGQGASNVLQGGQQVAQGGAGMQGAAVNQYAQSSGVPYSTFNTIGQGQTGAVGQLMNANQQAQQTALNPVQAYLQYLGLGNQSNSVANQGGQLALNQAQLGFNQQQTLGSNFGSGLAGLTNQNNMNNFKTNWNWLTG